MNRKKVLVAPMDWGLGHATRCIPLIRLLQNEGHVVCLAGAGESLALLRLEFPDVEFFELPAYNPRYPRSGAMMATLASQALHFVAVVRDEQKVIEMLICEHSIDYVISDNRYGCYSERIPCAIITHQLNLLAPAAWAWLAWMANSLTGFYRNKFAVCWVPDWPGSILSGKLSATTDREVKFIGPLSRFNFPHKANEVKTLDVLILISGPEPQRSIFETIVINQIRTSQLRIAVLRGVIGSSRNWLTDTIEVIDHLPMEEIHQYLTDASLVISRSGYSTVMDLQAMHKKAVFIPTPGQTEQEYLAGKLEKSGIAYSVTQDQFDFAKAVEAAKKYAGFTMEVFDNDLLLRHLHEFLTHRKKTG
jgi:uncharacterized protein (TIGR00661 family)